jgi:hypothetical protein
MSVLSKTFPYMSLMASTFWWNGITRSAMVSISRGPPASTSLTLASTCSIVGVAVFIAVNTVSSNKYGV